MTTTTATLMSITPDEAAKLWYDAIDGAYDDEPEDDEAECIHCGGPYANHDGTSCPPDDEGYEGEGYMGNSVAYLSDYARYNDELVENLIAAYEATKHISYADMPAYEYTDMYNPWNVMNDLRMTDYFEALDAAYEWAEGWMDYTNAN